MKIINKNWQRKIEIEENTIYTLVFENKKYYRENIKELVKFEELFDRISQNRAVRVEGEGNIVNIFYEDNVEYKVYLLNEKAEKVEKNLKNKLNIK